jgi:hypothetical protein
MLKTTWCFSLAVLIGLLGPAGCGGGTDECAGDGDCPPGQYCRKGECAFDCTLDSDCPQGFRCDPHGRCERGCAESNGGVEACDGLDNDCDGDTDEEWSELGQPCRNGGCAEGLWVCAADGGGAVCDGPQPAADDSTCDGVDDDCDGAIDDDIEDRPCPLTLGVCAGAEQHCVDGSWTACDYGPDYAEQERCDGLDNDCDGDTDEQAPVLLQAELDEQAGDGLDNNCNGLVDEPGGLTLQVNGYSGWVDAYEMVVSASADCSGPFYGQQQNDYPAGWPASQGQAELTLYACSLPDVIPSGHLSWHQARRACAAQGKVLCSGNTFEVACTQAGTFYPYGARFLPGVCNDGWWGMMQQDEQVRPTGSMPGCITELGLADMSGNLAEWVDQLDPDYPPNALVGGYGYLCQLCDNGRDCWRCDLESEDDQEFLKRVSSCIIAPHNKTSYPPDDQRAYIGSRCCVPPP